MRTFDSYSFGCRVNQAEKEQLDRELSGLGLRQDSLEPDLYVVNTCAVTHKAEREARQLIYRVRRRLPKAKIVVTGCAATDWIKRKLDVKGADVLIDNANKEFLARLLLKRAAVPHKASLESAAVADKYTGSGRAIVKIQDGCQRFCTFCIVPYLRGLPKSYPVNELIARMESFGSLREIIITAINTEAYGYGTPESFLDLLKATLDRTAIPRISFGSIHPWSINAEFFDFYRNYPGTDRIVNFFHIPLQSGSNKILTLMKRDYRREDFIERLDSLDKIKPHTFIGTDVIVGFLEESDRDFEDTYDFLKNSPVSKFHVFRFSQRSHTSAFYMTKRLEEPSPEKKHARAKALISLGQKKYSDFLDTHQGHTFDALFLEKREDGWQHALLSNQIPVVVKTGKDLKGTINRVKIDAVKQGRLTGRLV